MSVDNFRKFSEDGYVHIKDFFSNEEVMIIEKNMNYIYSLPEVPYKWMKYYEDKLDQLSRVEYFYKYSCLEFINLIECRVKPFLENLYGSKLNLFKDKINWKLPGGGSFKPHQDHPAWIDFKPDRYINTMFFLDEMTLENGCLEVSTDMDRSLVHYELNKDGSLMSSVTDSLSWTPIIGGKRDLLIFDSYIPHRSGVNLSNKSRRAMFLTYNDVKYGYLYEDYFIKKREEFPPPIEREEGKEYTSSKYNLANPIK